MGQSLNLYLARPSGKQLSVMYLLAWESMGERETKWGAFSTDPEWIEKRGKTEENGPLVQTFSNQFLKPTKFSSVK